MTAQSPQELPDAPVVDDHYPVLASETLTGPSDGAWRARAACAGEDVDLFVSRRRKTVPERTQELCSSCPVNAPCLEEALRGKWLGIWGGTTEAGRRRIRTDRRLATAPRPP